MKHFTFDDEAGEFELLLRSKDDEALKNVKDAYKHLYRMNAIREATSKNLATEVKRAKREREIEKATRTIVK